MTRRERVLRALSFQETDRVPMDLAGMASTGISCFAYPNLRRALGLPPRRPRVYDTGQMLALPDLDVLDALDIDVVTVMMDATNAFEQPELWHPYDFNGRLDALVQEPAMFQALPDGTVVQPQFGRSMPPSSHVFESEHGGQPFDLAGDIPKPDPEAIRAQYEKSRLREEDVERLVKMLERVRAESDRAVFFCGPGANIGIGNFSGIAIFPIVCMMYPELVAELHEIITGYATETLEMLLPAIGPYIDIYLVSADDWGTQSGPLAAPDVYKDLFQPYYRRFNDTLHRLAPAVKSFLHSCGAIYDLIDPIIESGFDILNPVQWVAGGHSYQEWKDRARGRIALWGGGINTQVTLPLGTPGEVAREAAEITEYMKQGGGFVFCAIHNILAEIPGEKVVAMYRAAARVH